MLAANWVDAGVAAVFGLLIGSFLNVVIYRLPKILERQWKSDCAELNGDAPESEERFNLLVPRSRCSSCGHQIRWFENVPVASYIFLRGKCSACSQPISLRYPLVEIVTAGLFAYCVSRWGWGAQAFAYCLLSAALLTLALIDWDTTLLPDDITLPLLWAGLIAANMGWIPTTLPAAMWGAVGGYVSLWSVFWAFKLTTGKDGMGYGDFKLYAALGAWFGWTALIPVILMSSVIGAVVGIAMKLRQQTREGGYIPFGPFLAGSGMSAMIMGPDAILKWMGL